MADVDTATIVLISESAIMGALLLGWYFGARKKNIQLHRFIGYGALAVHLVAVLLWMVPRAMASGYFDDTT